jgi:hypothetical protein
MGHNNVSAIVPHAQLAQCMCAHVALQLYMCKRTLASKSTLPSSAVSI